MLHRLTSLTLYPKGDEFIDLALNENVHVLQTNELRTFRHTRNRSQIKKFGNELESLVKLTAKSHDVYFCRENLIRQVPRSMGPCLNKVGRFPRILTMSETPEEAIQEYYHSIRAQIRRREIALQFVVGHVGLSVVQLAENIQVALRSAIEETLNFRFG